MGKIIKQKDCLHTNNILLRFFDTKKNRVYVFKCNICRKKYTKLGTHPKILEERAKRNKLSEEELMGFMT